MLFRQSKYLCNVCFNFDTKITSTSPRLCTVWCTFSTPTCAVRTCLPGTAMHQELVLFRIWIGWATISPVIVYESLPPQLSELSRTPHQSRINVPARAVRTRRANMRCVDHRAWPLRQPYTPRGWRFRSAFLPFVASANIPVISDRLPGNCLPIPKKTSYLWDQSLSTTRFLSGTPSLFDLSF